MTIEEEFRGDGLRLELELEALGLPVRFEWPDGLCFCLTYGCECFKLDALEALIEESAERPLDEEETSLLARLKGWATTNGWRPVGTTPKSKGQP